MTLAKQIEALEYIIRDTETLSIDYGRPHVAETAKGLIEAIKADAEELVQYRVHLAGCLTAAEGWIGPNPPKQGDWAWSPALQAVIELRANRDALYSALEMLVSAEPYRTGREASTAQLIAIARGAMSRARGEKPQ